MTEVSFEKDAVRFSFGKPGFNWAANLIFAILALGGLGLLAGGLAIVGFDRLSPENLLALWFSAKKDSLAALALFLMGWSLACLPVVAIVSRRRGGRHWLPAAFVLDNFRQAFVIQESAANGGGQAAIPYADILDFARRHYTTRSDQHVHHHYTLCLVLREGAFWDLYVSRDKKEIDALVDRVKSFVPLAAAPDQATAAPVPAAIAPGRPGAMAPAADQPPALSPKIRYTDDGRRKTWVWTNRSQVRGAILAILWYLPFAACFAGVARIQLAGLIIAGFFLVLILAFLVYRLARTIKDRFWDCAIILSQGELASGRMRRGGGRTIAESTVSHQAGCRVLYSFDMGMESEGVSERMISLVSGNAAGDIDRLQTGLLQAAAYLASLLQPAGEGKEEIRVFTYGLLCSELVGLDRLIERELK